MTTATIPRHDDARRHRIRRLEALIDRATSELLGLRSAEARIRTTTHRLGLPTPTDDPTTKNTPAGRIRAWAHAQGLPIANTGRIPTGIRNAYALTHPDNPTAEDR